MRTLIVAGLLAAPMASYAQVGGFFDVGVQFANFE